MTPEHNDESKGIPERLAALEEQWEEKYEGLRGAVLEVHTAQVLRGNAKPRPGLTQAGQTIEKRVDALRNKYPKPSDQPHFSEDPLLKELKGFPPKSGASPPPATSKKNGGGSATPL